MKPMRLLLIALLAGTIVAELSAYRELPPPERLELPPPRSPEESLRAITVAPGLVVELVAAEPLVLDPIDVAWGADGRLWVVEMADYPEGIAGQPGGRIRILESTRGDGRYDRSTVFASGLKYPTAVLPWREGVLVVAVPDILWLRDGDGDGRADQREVLYTGLAEGNPQHLANGLQWALDGWLHLANGDSGGKVRSVRTGAVLELGRRDFRISPEDGGLEPLAGHSQGGRNRDDWGNWFGSNNSNPIWHYVLEDRYLRRNPHLVPPPSTVSVAEVPGAARVYPTSRTLARFNDPHGLNHFTSACGTMIYRDAVLGAEFAGNVFVCEPVHNLVHRQVLTTSGATFTSRRPPEEQNAEFLASQDNWSRFTSARAGPDGALYLTDMYRLVIEHPQWIPAAWRDAVKDLRAGDDRGRIYRVRPAQGSLRPMARLDRASTAELVAELAGVSGLRRDLAQQQLLWRRERGAIAGLQELASSAALPAARSQALWTLRGLGALEESLVRRALGDPHPGVRRQAVQLSEGWADRSAELLRGIAALAADADAMVRLQVGFSLGEFADRAAGEALAGMLRTERDRWVRTAALSSAVRHADVLLSLLARDLPADDPVLLEVAMATANTRALARMLAAIAAGERSADRLAQFRALSELLDWLQRHQSSLSALVTSAPETFAPALAAVDRVFAQARTRAMEERAPVEERVAALGLVGRGRNRQDDDLDLLARLLAPQMPQEVQLATVAAFGRMNRLGVPERLLEGWTAHGPALRAAILDALTSRPAWAQVLLDRVERDAEFRAQLSPAIRLVLTEHANARLRERAVAVLRHTVDADRQQVIDRYRETLEGRTGDAERGRQIFMQSCQACHGFGPLAGGGLGPDLASVKDRSAPYLLTHILDPNRAVEERYALYTATVQDGRVIAGLLTGETANSITLRGLDGTEHVVMRSDLRALLSTSRSLMPEGLEGAVSPTAMADLLAFLAGAAR